MLCFRDLGASFSSFGYFVFEIWVLRASVFVLESFRFRNYWWPNLNVSKMNLTSMQVCMPKKSYVFKLGIILDE